MTERALRFAALMRKPEPAIFEVASSLNDEDRIALARMVSGWLGGKRPSQASLLSFVRAEDWPELVAAAARVVIEESDEDAHDRAFNVLDEAARQFPKTVAPHLPALAKTTIKPWRVRSWTEDVEAERAPTLHLAFAHEDVNPRWPDPTQGPTPKDAKRISFGGTSKGTCGFCHGALHHLVTLEPGMARVDRRIELATCLTCLGWEQPTGDYALSFHHDEDGSPTPIDRLDTPLTPQFPTQPFRAMSVPLFDAGPRYAIQSWGASGRGQNLNRLAGEPSWVQDEEIRDCVGCAAPMRVVLQLDSELPQEGGRTFSFGSGGLLYVQLCDDCSITTMFWQCT